MYRIKFLSLALLSCLICACASRPVDIPSELTPEELIQRGQEASDRNRYKQSLQYYEAILERFPTNIDLICAAEYEIAFIHYKQKKYGQAEVEFRALLGRYDTLDAELLPQQFRILSEIVLAKLTEQKK